MWDLLVPGEAPARESCSGQPNLFLAKPDRIMWTGTAGQLAGKHGVFSFGDVAGELPQQVAAGGRAVWHWGPWAVPQLGSSNRHQPITTCPV